MNIIDKTIEAISPNAALKRMAARVKIQTFERIFNTGYSHSGASRQKKSMQGWNSTSKSPQEDIGNNLAVLRQRSRDLYMGAPIATAAIVKNRNNVLGAGMTLKCRLDHILLGITEKEARAWEKKTEFDFNIWAKSKIDHTGLNNFYDTQCIMLGGWLLNGDSIAIMKYADTIDINNPYRLRIHCIEADRLSTPDVFGPGPFYGFGFEGLSYNECSYRYLPNGGAIYNGVETDWNGKVVAYWFCNKYPNSDLPPYGAKKWQRVEAINSFNGMPNVLFVMNADRAEQYRGVPLLAPVIEIIKQMSRLTEAELAAAIVNSFFTAFITTESPANEFPLSDSIPAEQQTTLSLEERLQTYELGPATINALAKGESVTFGDPKHPVSGFEPFILTMCKLLGAAIDMPYEVLLGVFQSSYSASKAALLQAWRGFKTKRQWFAADYNQLIYEMWLYEAVATGRISAPGFFSDVTMRKLWSNAMWIGPSQGHINPTDEVRAADMRVASGYATHESETVEMNGQDWEENVQILGRENMMLQAAKASLKGGEKGAQNTNPNANQ